MSSPSSGRIPDARAESSLKRIWQSRSSASSSSPGKPVLPPQRPDVLGRSQRGQEARNPGIDDLEQRAGTWQFQHHIVGTPSQVREPRQDENVGVAELRRARPIIGPLRLDHHLVLLRSRAKAVLQETMPGQPADQLMELPIDVPDAGRQRAERQTAAQVPGALRCAHAELAPSPLEWPRSRRRFSRSRAVQARRERRAGRLKLSAQRVPLALFRERARRNDFQV